MSEVFQTFAEIMGSKSRANLTYIPQANGQQERSVKTMIQTVRLYVKGSLQVEWSDIAERLVHPINNSRESTINRPYLPTDMVGMRTLHRSHDQADPANTGWSRQIDRLSRPVHLETRI